MSSDDSASSGFSESVEVLLSGGIFPALSADSKIGSMAESLKNGGAWEDHINSRANVELKAN